MEIIKKYFPGLSYDQIDQFSKLGELYRVWNKRINLISRQDIKNLYEHHVLYSLAIAKYVTFAEGSRIMDVGTGGGFPGIPLAILFPDVDFYLIDGRLKKIRVVNEIVEALKLKNITAKQVRVEDLNDKFDCIVSRAVTSLPRFYNLVQKNLLISKQGDLNKGIFYLKGGEVIPELTLINKEVKVIPISDYFSEPFFETKKIIFIPA